MVSGKAEGASELEVQERSTGRHAHALEDDMLLLRRGVIWAVVERLILEPRGMLEPYFFLRLQKLTDQGYFFDACLLRASVDWQFLFCWERCKRCLAGRHLVPPGLDNRGQAEM